MKEISEDFCSATGGIIQPIEDVTQNSTLQVQMDKPFSCDYVDAIKLCRSKDRLNKMQLEQFLMLEIKGKFLKGLKWHWLDETRG